MRAPPVVNVIMLPVVVLTEDPAPTSCWKVIWNRGRQWCTSMLSTCPRRAKPCAPVSDANTEPIAAAADAAAAADVSDNAVMCSMSPHETAPLASPDVGVWWAPARWGAWLMWAAGYAGLVAVVRGVQYAAGLPGLAVPGSVMWEVTGLGLDSYVSPANVGATLLTIGHAWLAFELLPRAAKCCGGLVAPPHLASQAAGAVVGLGLALGLHSWWGSPDGRIVQLTGGALLWFAQALAAVITLAGQTPPGERTPAWMLILLTEEITRLIGFAAWMVVFVRGPLPLWMFWAVVAWHTCVCKDIQWPSWQRAGFGIAHSVAVAALWLV